MQTSPLDPSWVPPPEDFGNAVGLHYAVDLLEEVADMLEEAIRVMYWATPRLNLRPLVESLEQMRRTMMREVAVTREAADLLYYTDDLATVFPDGCDMSGEDWTKLDNPILSPSEILLLYKTLQERPQLPRVRYRDVLKKTACQPQHIEQYYRNFDKSLQQVFREVDQTLNPGMEEVCPRCGVWPHQWCVTPSGNRARSIHKQRLVAVKKRRLITPEVIERARAEGDGDLPFSCFVDGTYWDIRRERHGGDETEDGDEIIL